jgi:transposase-like protein
MSTDRSRCMERLKRRRFTAEFKLEAARYVLDRG